MEYDRGISLHSSTFTTCTVDIQLLVNEKEEVHNCFWDGTVSSNYICCHLWRGSVHDCYFEIHSNWSFLGRLLMVLA